MKKLILILSVFSILVFNSSCQKINQKKIWKCNNKQNYDSADVVNKLIGSWKWKYYSSPVWTTKQYKADKDVMLTFNSDLTISQSENGSVINGTWEVKQNSFWNCFLEYSPSSIYIHGSIAFCRNDLIFDATEGDGNIYQAHVGPPVYPCSARPQFLNLGIPS